jgi:2-methylisocitrate lyase-like PEP mutase family enzyme
VVPAEDMVLKIRVAAEARRHPETMIVARTDARTALGLDEALRRARLYEEAGADVIFVESPESEDELERIGREVSKPLLANMVEFGKTPRVETDRLKKWGFDIAIYPGLGFSVAAEAMRQGWQHLKDKGTSVGMNVPQFSGMHELMGFPEVWEFEKKWAL